MQLIVKTTCWSGYLTHVDLSLFFFYRHAKKKSLHCQCVDHSSSFDDVVRIHGIGYESLRNVAMHFKAFKSVKNAFYSSAVVTRPSQAPIFRQLGESHSQMYFVFWVRES